MACAFVWWRCGVVGRVVCVCRERGGGGPQAKSHNAYMSSYLGSYGHALGTAQRQGERG